MNSSRSFWQQVHSKIRSRFPGFADKLPAYIQLTRADRPIGILLLLWPTITALWIAAEGFPDLGLLLIFIAGTAVMRSAGCCVNDFADHNIDGKVARTENRPLATGSLKRQDALYCFLFLSLIGFGLVLLTNQFTILLSFGALAVASVYPFMKRYTNLPQVVLGIAFSFGILMAFTAQTDTLPITAWLLFVANVMWTVAYDTEYAMVDREFDKQIGVKSTAILFGDTDRVFIGALQAMFIMAMWLVGRQLQLGLAYYVGLLIATGLIIYQQYLIRNRLPGPCFKAFLNNNWVGAAIFSGTMLSYL